MRRALTSARALGVLLALILLPAGMAQAGPCPAVPSVDPIDMGLSEIGLSPGEAERVLRLRAAVNHHWPSARPARHAPPCSMPCSSWATRTCRSRPGRVRTPVRPAAGSGNPEPHSSSRAALPAPADRI